MKQYFLDDFSIYEWSSGAKETRVLFFAHANGVPAQTYHSFFSKFVQDFPVRVIAYDMRGMGLTQQKASFSKDRWGWDILIQDYVNLFKKIKAHTKSNAPFVLCGHSLGAWLAYLASFELQSRDLFLFDPPILPTKVAFSWGLIHILRKRHLNPNSKKVLQRTVRYDSFQKAFDKLKKSQFMKNWQENAIEDYIQGSFATSTEDDSLLLRHDPRYEAHLFEEFPPGAALCFLKLPAAHRKQLRPIFFVGSQSNTCNPKASFWVKLFVPRAQWILIPKSGHMFFMENPQETMDALGLFVVP